ncbi:uroplakin 2 [Cricetulus griseus]
MIFALPSPLSRRLQPLPDVQDPRKWKREQGREGKRSLSPHPLGFCTKNSFAKDTSVRFAKYRLQLVEPPRLPLEKKPNPDKDGPDIKPNLWMWVSPNIVYPPGKLEVERPKKDPLSVLPSRDAAVKEEEASCSEGSEAQARLPSSSQPSRPCKRKTKQKHIASSPSTWEELTEEEEAKDQDDSSSVALPSLPTRAPLQRRRRLQQAISPEGKHWSRPPLNYFQLIALALRNSPPCGLNVQEIYSFTRNLKAPIDTLNFSQSHSVLGLSRHQALTESLLVALPPCHLTGGNATLMVRRANDSKVVKSVFMVPPCRGRRELVSVVDSGAGFTVTRLSAYQVTNLTPGTKYYISYRVQKGTSTESSPETPMSTLPRRNMESIGLGMARTGGMVVITVLLSVAMFLLVVGLIVALALGARK